MPDELDKIITEYKGKVCVYARWLYDRNRVMSKPAYDKYNRMSKINVVRRAAKNRPALVEFQSIPPRFKDRICAILDLSITDIMKTGKNSYFKSKLEPDYTGIKFFSNYRKPSGRLLTTEKAKEMHTNVMFLRACNTIEQEVKGKRKALGISPRGIWQSLSDIVNDLQLEYNHTLPGSARRLRDRAKKLRKFGYESLVNGNVGNSNARKVDEMLERLIISLASMESNPFVEHVHDDYMSFLAGKTLIVDSETGELFDRFDFQKDEKPLTISTATVWNIMNNPVNKALIDSKTLSASEHHMKNIPYVRRKSPEYSYSKVSLDDRTLPRKSSNYGWINAYYAFDVASDCVIGVVYSHENPNLEMVYELFQNMVNFADDNNLYWPLECEVEQHLMSRIESKLNMMFDYVRMCNPTNSREKRAEHKIRGRKYQTEKRFQSGIGRWHGKGKYKINQDKKKKLEAESVIADDIKATELRNNSLHPNQKKYPGKTRLDVLHECVNPEARRPQKYRIAKEVGYKAETSIRNNDLLAVQYEEYWIDSDIMSQLEPNNKDVDAYYIPKSDGSITDVYIYQGDNFLCRGSRIEKYQESQAERTERDYELYIEHQKRAAIMRKKIKDNSRKKVAKVELLDADQYEKSNSQEVEIYEELEPDNSWSLSEEEMMKKALDEL